MLYLGGRHFWKAFRIVGLEARKSRRGVEQDLYGNFRANFKCFFFFSFSSGLLRIILILVWCERSLPPA